MAKLTVSLLSLFVLFYLAPTSATYTCSSDCTQDKSDVLCVLITIDGNQEHQWVNECTYYRLQNCRGSTTSAIIALDGDCNNDPLYQSMCGLLGVNINLLPSYTWGCTFYQGQYTRQSLLNARIGLLGWGSCARQGQIVGSNYCN